MGSKYATVLPTSKNLNEPIYKDFFMWKSVTNIVTMLYYHNRFTIQKDKALNTPTIGLFHGTCLITQQTVSLLLPFVDQIDPYFVN